LFSSTHSNSHLAFKRHTNDIRNSAALGLTKFLLEKEIKVINAFDPVAGKNYHNYFNNNELINLSQNELEVIENSDVIIIVTDWPQFRELSNTIKEKFSKGALIMDGRRMLQNKYGELSENGFNIVAVGSPLIKRK
jgi:UDPglucose 6-dehydrogenase